MQRTYDTLTWGKNYEKAMLVKEELIALDSQEREAWDLKQVPRCRVILLCFAVLVALEANNLYLVPL